MNQEEEEGEEEVEEERKGDGEHRHWGGHPGHPHPGEARRQRGPNRRSRIDEGGWSTGKRNQ